MMNVKELLPIVTLKRDEQLDKLNAEHIIPVMKIEPNHQLEKMTSDERKKLKRQFSEAASSSRKQIVPIVKLLNLSDLLDYHYAVKMRKLDMNDSIYSPVLKLPRVSVPQNRVGALELYTKNQMTIEEKRLKLAQIIVEKLKSKKNGLKENEQETSVPQKVGVVDYPEPIVKMVRIPEIEEVVKQAIGNDQKNNNNGTNSGQRMADSENSCPVQNKDRNTNPAFRSLYYCGRCGMIFTYNLYLMKHQLRHGKSGNGILKDISNSAHEQDTHRMLTDDEVWAGVKGLASPTILVLPPAICLKVIHSGQEDIRNVLQDIDFQKLAIIAPISNAESNDMTGFNTEGTHWSLVIVNLKKKEFGHLDSITGYNRDVALQFSQNMNTVLKFDEFKFTTKKCHKQNDKYSCGYEVIENAKKQVKLLERLNSPQPRQDVPMAQSSFSYKQRLIIIGDDHAQNMIEFMSQLMPHYEVSFDMTMSGDEMMGSIPLLTKHLSSNDCILAIRGNDQTDPALYGRAALQISGLMATTTATLTGAFPDVPHLTFFIYTVKKSFKAIE